MRRVCGFLAALLLAAAPAGQAPAPPPAPTRTVKLADNLYEITVFAKSRIWTKMLALIGPDRVLLVDSITAETAPAVRDAVEPSMSDRSSANQTSIHQGEILQ